MNFNPTYRVPFEIYVGGDLFERGYVKLQKVKIENLRVYFNVQNLWTITGYKGYDPEVGAYNQGVLLRGVDYARYPSQRIYTFGLNLNL